MDFKKNISELEHYDIVVIGGGPAGVAASIAAAGEGAKVLLIEASSTLGGMATSGLVGPFMTSYNKGADRPIVGGLFRKILKRLDEKGAVILPENTDAPSIHTSFIAAYHRHVTPFDSFMLSVVLDEMVAEAGVDVLLYTRFVDAVVESGEIKSVVLAALEGLVCLSADVFIDCTGTADVAAASGVPTYKGDEVLGIPQPGTLMFEVSNVDDEKYTSRPKYPVKAYRMPVKGVYKVNHYHTYSTDAANSKSMTEAHIKARGQVLDAFAVLKNETPGFELCELKAVASTLGVRESRHIEGKYKIKVEDVKDGVKFNDRIACYGFGMDVHSRTDAEKGNFKVEIADLYYIPYRSLVPNNINNLLVAGKTISCESQAAGGLRCMPSCIAMGEAAGIAAAISIKESTRVENIDVQELQRKLIANGAILD